MAVPLTLTQLARKTIQAHFNHERFDPDERTKKLYDFNKASFVTLTKNGELKGCIGSLTPSQELWKDVQENALNAAFSDFRFVSVREEDLKDIKIEVSVLTEPKRLTYNDEEDLLKKINSLMGIILKKGSYQATFLPQVWKELPDKEEFLKQLSLKAGLREDAWKSAEIFYYHVKSEEEK